MVEVNLRNKPEWFHNLNREGSTPVLQLDEHRILTESLIICDYLEEALQGKELLPFDAYIKAYHKLLIQKFSNVTAPFTRIVRKNDIDALNELKCGLKLFEDNLNYDFFEGKNVSFIDLMIWPWFERFPLLKEKANFELGDEFPKLNSWVKRMSEIDIIKNEIKTVDKYRDFYSSH